MNSFIAKSAKQLNLCLRMLYAENVDFVVSIFENDKGKILYSIGIDASKDEFDALKEKYRKLIS